MKDVTVYTTPTCMYCNLLKDYLEEKGVEYKTVDVSENEEARDMIIEKSGQMGVPVTIIDEEVIIGFDEDKVNEVLELK